MAQSLVTTMMNRQIRLKSRPAGIAVLDNFETGANCRAGSAGDGDVLRRTIYLSLDPYMRGRMSDAPSYAAPVAIGDVMCGHTVSEVVESRNPGFNAGDLVTGYDGWQAVRACRAARSCASSIRRPRRSRRRSAFSACRA